MMNMSNQKTPFVFTLSEDEPLIEIQTNPEQTIENNAPEWERTLEQLRSDKKRVGKAGKTDETLSDQFPNGIFSTYGHNQSRRNHVSIDQNREFISGAREKKPDAVNNPNSLDQVILDPVQREQAYQAYLRQWQRQINLEAKQQEADLNDVAVLLQDDWLAAQNCLQTASMEGNAVCTVKLQRNKTAQIVETKTINKPENAKQSINAISDGVTIEPIEQETPPIYVQLHVIEPRGRAGRAVTCLSEQALIQQLTDKLRPHLADVLAGMVRVAVQRHTSSMISSLQKELLTEVPKAVDDVLQHHLGRIIKNIKSN